MSDYDAIITGSGASGCIAAAVLAEAGWRVLLLERGKLLSNAEIGRDHLRNQRLSLYGHNAGPDSSGNPRVAVDLLGNERIIPPHNGAYSNNAATVGGGTRVYGGQAWRFMPDDFRMATKYGIPEGSSLSDWPITYDELAPDYERAEWEIGVCGEHEGNQYQGPRSRPYPLPPVPVSAKGRALRGGADALGWSVFSPPQCINTVPYHGRDACVKCKYCVGFYCPSNAKNGTWNTVLPRALATGNCELVTRAMVERIDTNSQGDVVGATYFVEENGSVRRVSATAKRVVCASGAIETARLLLNSTSDKHPAGLGNANDMVGRNLQGHYYPGAAGLLEESIYDGIGPGVSTATCRFNHNNAGIIGGGMLADDYIRLPIIFWRGHLAPGTPRWGAANKAYMRDNYARSLNVMGPLHEIPSPGLPRHDGGGRPRPLRHTRCAIVRRHAPGNGSDSRVYGGKGGGVDSGQRRSQNMALAGQSWIERGTASGGNVPHGYRPANLRHGQMGPRPCARQPAYRGRFPARHQRRLQSRPNHYGAGVPRSGPSRGDSVGGYSGIQVFVRW